MPDRVHLLLPLSSSLLYVAGALLVKRCAELGVGVWRTAFVANLASALLFIPVTALGGAGQPAHLFWQPALLGFLLVAGQALAFLALSRGDVSVATPVLGIKTVLVACLTPVVLAQPVPLNLWAGAMLSTAGIVLLNRRDAAGRPRAGLTVLLSITAAGGFALFDVLVQKWSPRWGAGRLLPLANAMAAAYSLGMIPLFRAPLWAIPRTVWPWLLGGSACIALQGVILITTVGVFGDATAVNIVYSSRGLWSVAAVWLVGHWFANREQDLGRRVLAWRLAGALLMMAAILLVLI